MYSFDKKFSNTAQKWIAEKAERKVSN